MRVALRKNAGDALDVTLRFDGKRRKAPFVNSRVDALRNWTSTDRGLIEAAARALSTSPERVIEAGALLYAKRAIASKHGAQQGSARGRVGSRDADLSAAFDALRRRGEDPTPARVAREARVGFYTAKAWLLRTQAPKADISKARRRA